MWAVVRGVSLDPECAHVHCNHAHVLMRADTIAECLNAINTHWSNDRLIGVLAVEE